METPAFEEMDDDAFLGFVSEGGDPPGSSKRPRQCLEPAVMSSAPSFDATVHAIAIFKFNNSYSLLRCNLIRSRLRLNPVGNLRTDWGHKKFHDCTSVLWCSTT